MKKHMAIVVGIVMLAAGTDKLQAASIYIPNASFELPETVSVSVDIDSWQKSPKPGWYDESRESRDGIWILKMGVFFNNPNYSPKYYIDNCDGNQAAWLWAYPEVELFQDLTATFEVGYSYHLTVGIFGGGGDNPLKDDVPIEIRLYYRDAENNKVTIGTTAFVYDSDTCCVMHFNDVRLDIPHVKTSDPWAGKNIGVQLISNLTLADLDEHTGRAGGWWNLDNVRLTKLVDLTGDSFINLEDFAIMAREWLSCSQTTTDLTGDGCVNMDDLMILVQFWLESMQE